MTLFIDDLQWIDAGTLKLLPLMSDIPYLFIIGAYRDNEVDNTHPLISTLNELAETNLAITTIKLEPLAVNHIQALLSDSLYRNSNDCMPLVQLIQEKTGGNPFFMGEFLKALYYEELLNFDYQNKFWDWNIEKIRQKNITSNVVELLVNKMNRLPEISREFLSLGSVLGNSIDLELLAICAEVDLQELKQQLWFCLQEGLLIIQNQQTYKFVHDRVQQAAYSLIQETDRPALHLKIARLLKAKLSAQELSEQLFSVVDHFNLGRQLLTEKNEEEIRSLVKFNFEAGKRAKLANAYQIAYDYLQIAIALLSEQSWQTNYNFTLELYNHAVEAAYLCHYENKLVLWGQEIIAHAQTPIDTYSLYITRIHFYYENLQTIQALTFSLEILDRLGISLTLQPKIEDMQAHLTEVAQLISEIGTEALLNVSKMQDKEKIAAIELFVHITLAAYTASPILFFVVVAIGVKLSIQYGNAHGSSYMYALYSMVVAQNQPELSYQLGQVAIQLADRFQSPYMRSRTYFACALISVATRAHAKETVTLIEKAKQISFAQGDGQFFSYLSYVKSYYSSLIDNSLLSIWELLFEIEALLKKYNHKLNLGWNSVYIWYFGQLMATKHECPYYPEMIEQQMHIANDITGLCLLDYRRAMIIYLLQPLAILESLQLIQKSETMIAGIAGLLDAVFIIFHGALIRLAAIEQSSAQESEWLLHQAQEKLAILEVWAKSAPINFQHQCDLIAAEIARVTKNYWLAGTLYQKAILGAKQNDYLRDEALAGELAGRFYRKQGLDSIAYNYLVDSHYAYQRWGAVAKVNQLEETYPFLRSKKFTSNITTSTTTKKSISYASTSTYNSVHQSGNSLDILSVIKASQTLASEIQLDKLLQQLLQILLASAGASRGVILLPEKQYWFVQADSNYGKNTDLLNSPLATYSQLPNSLIHYVIRTQNKLIIDKINDSQFNNDPYFNTQPPLSLLCLPLAQQNNLNGILYLENKFTANAFTTERIALLEMLSGQMLISIENALLYRNLEIKVKERTLELSNTLDELKTTQSHLIESEKMAALGQLVTGVAHEINTPLGAISSSATNIQKFLEQSLAVMPSLFRSFSEQECEEFLIILARSLNNDNLNLSTKERRQKRRILINELGDEINDADTIADTLVDMGIYDNITNIMDLLKKHNGYEILELVYKLSELKKGTQTITTATARTSKVVFALKSYAQQNDTGGEKIKFNLIDNIEIVLTLYANQMKHGLNLMKHYADNIPMIHGYPDELNQVWTNIIHNALQAMNHQGVLIITVKQDNTFIKITIQDSGIGIKPENINKIFDAFYTTKGMGEGSGLGLYIVKKIIEKHTGRIEVESEIGRTVFNIFLPIY